MFKPYLSWSPFTDKEIIVIFRFRLFGLYHIALKSEIALRRGYALIRVREWLGIAQDEHPLDWRYALYRSGHARMRARLAISSQESSVLQKSSAWQCVANPYGGLYSATALSSFGACFPARKRRTKS